MTAEEFKARLRAEGFNLRLIWDAKETGENGRANRNVTVRCWSVYRASDGALLTSFVGREMPDGDATAFFVFWISETNRVDSDVDYLRHLADRLDAREA